MASQKVIVEILLVEKHCHQILQYLSSLPAADSVPLNSASPPETAWPPKRPCGVCDQPCNMT